MKKILQIIFYLLPSLCFAATLTNAEYAQLFKGYSACFILFDVKQQKIISEYNPHNYCKQRISPDSTFKIALSLMAFDQGVIKPDTVFKWDGLKGEMPTHRQDQTPKTWLQNSVVWVSQSLTPQLGYANIKQYLNEFKYGNQDFRGDPGLSNGLTNAWLASSLKISALEQLDFLNAFLTDDLPVSKIALENTKQNLYLGKLENGADYYGKTGSGRHGNNERLANPSLLRDGWFIGFVEDHGQQFIFVSNLTDNKVQASIDKVDGHLSPYGGQVIKPITLKILNAYFNNLPS